MGLKPVKSKLCRNFYTGDVFYCPHYQACCRDHCCTAPLSFYNLWYFWLFILLLLLLCSGGGYWYKRRFVPIPRSTLRGPYMTTNPLGNRNFFGQQPNYNRPYAAGNMYYTPGAGGPGYPNAGPHLNKPQYYYPQHQDPNFYAGGQQHPHMAPPPSYQDLYQDGAINPFPNPSIPIPMPQQSQNNPSSFTTANSPGTYQPNTNAPGYGPGGAGR